MTGPLPGAAVRRAFGVRGAPEPLPGGQGTSVRIGGLVFKPADADAAEIAWSARVAARFPPGAAVRVPAPARATDGRYVVDGWRATAHVPGVACTDVSTLLRVSGAFHGALRGLDRPDFLARRTHRWAVADRVAWGERSLPVPAAYAGILARLRAAYRPVGSAGQLVHGDLSGNVLTAPGLPPAVIDLSPYWRPARYADAIVAVDALLWYGAPDVPYRDGPDWRQYLLRALVFRLVAHCGPDSADDGEADRYGAVADALLRG